VCRLDKCRRSALSAPLPQITQLVNGERAPLARERGHI
jgi:hypothetical protein